MGRKKTKKRVSAEQIVGCMFIIGIILAVIIVCSSLVLPTSSPPYSKKYVIYKTDTPSGIYWTEIKGSGSILYYKETSNLKMSYTVQYFNTNSTIKTVVLDATSDGVTVQLLNTKSMFITFQYQYDNINLGRYYISEYIISVPNPNLFE